MSCCIRSVIVCEFDWQVMDEVRAAMAAHPGYRLLLVGHSMGAGTAAILTMMCATLQRTLV